MLRIKRNDGRKEPNLLPGECLVSVMDLCISVFSTICRTGTPNDVISKFEGWRFKPKLWASSLIIFVPLYPHLVCTIFSISSIKLKTFTSCHFTFYNYSFCQASSLKDYEDLKTAFVTSRLDSYTCVFLECKTSLLACTLHFHYTCCKTWTMDQGLQNTDWPISTPTPCQGLCLHNALAMLASLVFLNPPKYIDASSPWHSLPTSSASHHSGLIWNITFSGKPSQVTCFTELLLSYIIPYHSFIPIKVI